MASHILLIVFYHDVLIKLNSWCKEKRKKAECKKAEIDKDTAACLLVF